MYYKH